MPISFSCSGCDSPLRVADEMAGKKARCSRCGTITPIPGKAKADIQSEPPPRPKSKPSVDVSAKPKSKSKPSVDLPPADKGGDVWQDLDRDSGADSDDRPIRRKKKKKGKGLLYALLGGGFVFACCLCPAGLVGIDYFFLNFFIGGGLPSEQKYLPDNPDMVMSIRVGDLLDSKAYKKLKQDVPETEKLMKQFDESSEVPISNISYVLAGGGSGSSTESITVIRTKSAINAKDILDKRNKSRAGFDMDFEKGGGPSSSYKEVKVAGGKFTMYEGRFDAFCVPEDKVLVMGTAVAVRKVLERDGKPTMSSQMKDLIKQASFSKTIVFVANLRDSRTRRDIARIPGMPIPDADQLTKDAEGTVVQINVGSDIDVDVKVQCKDAKSAEETRKLVDGGLVAVKKQAEAGGKEVPREAIEIIDSVKLSTSGSTLTGKATIKTESVIKAVNSFKGMFPM